MEGAPVILLTILALAGVPLAMVAGMIVLVAAVVVIIARRHRTKPAPVVEPAE